MNKEQSLLECLQGNVNPKIEDILHCYDVLDAYRTGSPQLINLLTSSKGMEQIISIIRKCNEPIIANRILRMFILSKSAILSELATSNEFTEDLVKCLDEVDKVHPFVIGVITQILGKSLEVYSGDFYDTINSSNIIFTLLVKNIALSSVFSLCTQIVISSTETQAFSWFLFVSLMGEHGPGCTIPKSCSYEPAFSSPYCKLTPPMRKNVLELLFSYFREFSDTCDFYNEIGIALPLILNDAADDMERSIVFKLGLLLNGNDAMVRSALSILECMKSSDILLQFAIYYLQSFSRTISNPILELALYRTLHKQPNNFVLEGLAKIIQITIAGSSMDRSDLTENLKMILADAFQNKRPKTYLMRAFRMYFSAAAEGEDVDPELADAAERLLALEKESFIMDIDQDYIQQLKKKSDAIASSKTCVPIYSVTKLWESNFRKMEEKFKNIGPSPLSISSPTEQVKSTLNQKRPKPIKTTQEEEDFYYSDDYYDEEDTDELEAQKMREIIERQQAAKEQAEKSKKKKEKEIIEAPIAEVPTNVQQKTPAIMNLPSIPPVPKAAVTTSSSSSKGKGKTSKKGKKGKGKTSKKGKEKAPKAHLSFSMNVGVVDSPPVNIQNAMKVQSFQQLELNVSSLKLRPKKPRPVFDRKVLVIDCPLKKPSLEISTAKRYEVNLDDIYNDAPIKKTLTKEEIRKLVDEKMSDSEEDFDIEPLPSEMEEDSDDYIQNQYSSPIRPLATNKIFLLQDDEEEYFEEEEEEEESDSEENNSNVTPNK